jgi:hypothetical protein
MSTRTFRDAVAGYFQAHPHEWVDARVLMNLGGTFAWRTRVSDCRTQLGLNIENRQRKVGRVTVSEYKYVPPVEEWSLTA